MTDARQYENLAALLFSEPADLVSVPHFAWGFGGLHGGLALSLVASAAQRALPDHQLRSITGQFHLPPRETFAITSRIVRSGRTAGTVQATCSTGSGVALTATAILGSDQPGMVPTCAPERPDVPGPDSLPSIDGASLQVPVLRQVDVRPVGSLRPYVGGTEPTMMAWMRVAATDRPLDPSSVIFFLDALPPSYTAILTEARPVPTLEFSVHLGSSAPTSAWILVRSKTVCARAGGWVTEVVDAWSSDGAHLGSGQQIRLALAARPTV